MEDTSRLYDTLVESLEQLTKWLDTRHLKTLVWMIVGLVMTEKIGLTHWIPFVKSRATFAQSTQRRFTRWLHNDHIKVNELYGPIIQAALAEWRQTTLYLALDTSMLWGEYCIIRISIVYRGRAVPLVWKVLKHGSSSVAFTAYRDLLDAASRLLPLYFDGSVVFLADRGFADTELMYYLSETLKWHYRIRIKSNFLVKRPGHQRCKIGRIKPKPGEAHFLHNVRITEEQFGPVHLALANIKGSKEEWLIVSDQITSVESFDEYSLRFDIEENFLDDKSNGFQLASTLIRHAEALSRLCFVLALTTLYLVSVGTEMVQQEKRRLVDPHWFRGNSYLRIGWQTVKHALTKGWPLPQRFALSPLPDPEPSISSRTQFFALPNIRLKITFFRYEA